MRKHIVFLLAALTAGASFLRIGNRFLSPWISFKYILALALMALLAGIYTLSSPVKNHTIYRGVLPPCPGRTGARLYYDGRQDYDRLKPLFLGERTGITVTGHCRPPGILGVTATIHYMHNC
jgi:hypothetical protein